MLDDLDDDEAFAALTDAQRAAALGWLLNARVSIDGFEGWIESIGFRTRECITGLREMGAHRYADLLAEVLLLFPTAEARDLGVRLAAMDEWTPGQSRRLSRITDDFLTLSEEDSLIDHYVRGFIKARPKEFPQSVDDL